MQKECTHTDQIKEVTAQSRGCEECLKTGDEWLQLRLCLTCGHVGCCDSSKNKHARHHFEATQHAIIESVDEGQPWRWCYIDQTYL